MKDMKNRAVKISLRSYYRVKSVAQKRGMGIKQLLDEMISKSEYSGGVFTTNMAHMPRLSYRETARRKRIGETVLNFLFVVLVFSLMFGLLIYFG